MTRSWLALLEAPASDAFAQAEAHGADGTSIGWLAAWRQSANPVRGARRVDHRILDPAGDPAARVVHEIAYADGARIARTLATPTVPTFFAEVGR